MDMKFRIIGPGGRLDPKAVIRELQELAAEVERQIAVLDEERRKLQEVCTVLINLHKSNLFE